MKSIELSCGRGLGIGALFGAFVLSFPLAGAVTAQSCEGQWVRGPGVVSPVNANVYAMIVTQDGSLVAGGIGEFGSSGVRNIAMWAGSAWRTLGDGLNGTVYSLAKLSNGSIIAGGNFTIPGDRTASRNVAVWNGVSWSPLSSGLETVVKAIAVLPDQRIVAGGSDGAFSKRLSIWNGTAWVPMTFSLDGGVNAFAVLPNGDLIVGGGFSATGGMPSTNIARWNSAGWHPIVSDVINVRGNVVTSLLSLPDNSFVAGGVFLELGEIARFDGVNWTPLGQGMEDVILSMVRLQNGNIIAAGPFVAADYQLVWNIAMWNGSVWSALGEGLDDTAFCLADMGAAGVAVGGSFTTAGGMPTSHIAVWQTPQLAIAREPESQRACPGMTVTFTVSALGSPTFAWYKGGVPIALIDNPTAHDATLRINAAAADDVGVYTCTLTNACGHATTRPAQLTMSIGDFNCDGGVDGSDVNAFFTAWEAAAAFADVNADGSVDGADVGAFFERWEHGD